MSSGQINTWWQQSCENGNVLEGVQSEGSRLER
jgi:hypothetical protein